MSGVVSSARLELGIPVESIILSCKELNFDRALGERRRQISAETNVSRPRGCLRWGADSQTLAGFFAASLKHGTGSSSSLRGNRTVTSPSVRLRLPWTAQDCRMHERFAWEEPIDVAMDQPRPICFLPKRLGDNVRSAHLPTCYALSACIFALHQNDQRRGRNAGKAAAQLPRETNGTNNPTPNLKRLGVDSNVNFVVLHRSR